MAASVDPLCSTKCKHKAAKLKAGLSASHESDCLSAGSAHPLQRVGLQLVMQLLHLEPH